MSTLDLKTEVDRMIQERRGVSDATSLDHKFNDLATLKQDLKDMIAIRNGDLNLNKETCHQHVGSVCTQHKYSSVESLAKAISTSDVLSVGDIDTAISNLTYCTCDARQASGCICQDHSAKNQCACLARDSSYGCHCQSRDGGKYGPSWRHCQCNARTVGFPASEKIGEEGQDAPISDPGSQSSMCQCQGRTATNDCTCHGRCSCNVQKSFSNVKFNERCSCDAQIIPGCACHIDVITECTYNECSCVARDIACTCDLQISDCLCNDRTRIDTCDGLINHGPWYSECKCRSRSSACVCNVERNHDHGHSYRYTQVFDRCVGNVAPISYEAHTCTCLNRCSCDAKSVYK